MSEPIKAGDLVYCAKTCCEAQRVKHLGKIRRVLRVEPGDTECQHCGAADTGLHGFSATSKHGSPVWWLRRIPPIEELDDVKQDEEITA